MPDERDDRAAADGDEEPRDDAGERSTGDDDERRLDPPTDEGDDADGATGPATPDGGDPADGEPTIGGDGLSYGEESGEENGDGAGNAEVETDDAESVDDEDEAADDQDADAEDADDQDADAEDADDQDADADADDQDEDAEAADDQDEDAEAADDQDEEAEAADDQDADADDDDQDADADDEGETEDAESVDEDVDDPDDGGLKPTNMHKANVQSDIPRGKPKKKERASTASESASDAAEAEAAAETGTGTQEPTYPGEDVGGISTPPDDEEMPLADHIEEMISRVAVVLLFGAAGTAIGILWASDAIAFIWADVIPEAEEWPPHIYHPLELWLTRIKVAALLGIMVALPMFVYQCYLFMRPGLYPNERKYYLAAVPTSVVLAGVGMLFSYLLVLPLLFEYFTFYSEGSAEIHYALGETFNLVITLTAFLAIVFQIPLLIMMAIMMGVTSRRWLAEKRLYFWAAFAGLSFMFTFDPTMMAPVIVAIVMILLFEGTLAILKWVGVD